MCVRSEDGKDWIQDTVCGGGGLILHCRLDNEAGGLLCLKKSM